MQTRHAILATAGHVDHGKSALVKALTGTDPDRLPEEQARGITIDLGFAHLELPAPKPNVPSVDGAVARVTRQDLPSPPECQPERLSVGIVDVPGHEDFVKNMVAGVGSLDLALLVVAADDGWMPQTEEHLQILTYLGVTRAVVALTKTDLAEGREVAVTASVREQLQQSPFADAPIVPTSVVTGRGLEELKSAIARVLADLPPRRDLGKPRLPVDRVFTLKGIGTVVTGTLTEGTLVRGQSVVLHPTGAVSRIRSLQNHNADVEVSGPGTRTAVNLPDVEPRSETNPGGVARGDVLTVADLGAPSDTADVRLERSPRLLAGASPAARPLRDRTRVRVHFGSANVTATLFLHGTKELVAGGQVLAQARFESPVFLMLGDRFIVRDWSEQVTLGGGCVLDPDGDRKHWQAKPRLAALEVRAAAPDDVAVWVASQLARDHVLRRDAMLKKARCGEADLDAVVRQLAETGKAALLDPLVADATWWADLRRRAGERIDLEHRARPERVGLALSELKAALQEDLPCPGVFEALIADLSRGQFGQTATMVRRRTHRPALPPKLQAAGAFLRQWLAEKPLEPPSRKELAPDLVSQQALRFLLDTAEAVEISPEVVLSAEAYASAVARITEHLRQYGSATLSDLRQAVGSSRRIMVPLCEKLDRDGVTVRQGDRRGLGPRA